MNNETSDSTTSQDALRRDISEIQVELEGALHEIINKAGKKLPQAEMAAIKGEFAELNTLLERIKTGKIYVALFGRTSVGKSAIANAIMGQDIAVTGPEHDLTNDATYYDRTPWRIGDIPGVMGENVNEELALREARQCIGHIFVIEGEPFATEIRLFDLVHAAHPDNNKIVFVNKWDVIERTNSKANREVIRAKILEKMRKYVNSDDDIIFGSAALYDADEDDMIRQELPQLMDRLYANAGALGELVNVIDPANRALDLVSQISKKILEMRIKICRRVVSGFAIASVAGGAVPLDTLFVQPGLLGSLAYVLTRIMGKPITKTAATRMAGELIKTVARIFAVQFAAMLALDFATAAGTAIAPFLFFVFAAVDVALLGWYRFWRTATFGEVVMTYVQNDFSWGAEGSTTVVKKCEERARQHYARLRAKPGSSG